MKTEAGKLFYEVDDTISLTTGRMCVIDSTEEVGKIINIFEEQVELFTVYNGLQIMNKAEISLIRVKVEGDNRVGELSYYSFPKVTLEQIQQGHYVEGVFTAVKTRLKLDYSVKIIDLKHDHHGKEGIITKIEDNVIYLDSVKAMRSQVKRLDGLDERYIFKVLCQECKHI
jgi:hypothetical protein